MARNVFFLMTLMHVDDVQLEIDSGSRADYSPPFLSFFFPFPFFNTQQNAGKTFNSFF